MNNVEELWKNLKCPLCNGEEFESDKGYTLINMENYAYNLTKSDEEESRHTNLGLEVLACKQCGYSIMKREKAPL